MEHEQPPTSSTPPPPPPGPQAYPYTPPPFSFRPPEARPEPPAAPPEELPETPPELDEELSPEPPPAYAPPHWEPQPSPWPQPRFETPPRVEPQPTAERALPSFFDPQPEPAPSPEPPAERKIPILGVVGALLVTLLVLATLMLFGQVQSLRSDLREARTANSDLGDRLDGVAGEARTGLDRTTDLDRRLGEVELANDPAKVAKGVQPSVFTIGTDNELGSGFVVQKEAGSSLLATNFHVIESSWVGGDRTVDVFQDELKIIQGTVERVNESFDLALVRVKVELPCSGETVEPGQPVLVVGSPLGLGGSVSSGSISALRSFNAVQFIQFSAPISPGNSGGPVVNATGEVVGIAVAKFIDFGAEGLGFAIPISQLCVQLQVC